MKNKIILIIFLLLFNFGQCFGGGVQRIPAPNIFDATLDYTLTGNWDFSGEVGGTGLNDWLGAGHEYVTNLLPYSEDYNAAGQWDLKTNVTSVDSGTFQRVAQSGAGAADFMGTVARIPLDGRSTLFILKVKTSAPSTTTVLEYSTWDTAPRDVTDFLVTSDRYLTFRSRNAVPYVDDLLLSLNNKNGISGFSLDIAHMLYMDAPASALYNNGDSMSVSTIEGALDYLHTTYAEQYVDFYNADLIQEGVPSNLMTTATTGISARTITDLEGKFYPVIFLAGGLNDIQDGTPLDWQIAAAASTMCEAAKLSSNNIILLTIPIVPNWDGDATKTDKALSYNAQIKAVYLHDTFVTVLEVNSFLTSDDFADDGIHYNFSGQDKIFAAIKDIMPFPAYAETFQYIETDDTTYEDVNGAKQSEMINVNDFTEVNIDNSTSFYADSSIKEIFCDTTIGDVNVTIAPGTKISSYHIVNVGANDVIISTSDSEEINGASSPHILTSGDIILIFSSVHDWRG